MTANAEAYMTQEGIDRRFKQTVEALALPCDDEEFERLGVYLGDYEADNVLPILPGAPVTIIGVRASVNRALDTEIAGAAKLADGESVDPDTSSVVNEVDTGSRLWCLEWLGSDGWPVLRVTRVGANRFQFADMDDTEYEAQGEQVDGRLGRYVDEVMEHVNTNRLQQTDPGSLNLAFVIEQ